MDISQNGIALIKGFEGCRLEVYNDSVRSQQYPNGRPTIAWGHLILSGEDFSAGITQAQADALLLSDVFHDAEVFVSRLVPECNQNQYDALCSFTYNLGRSSLITMLGHGFQQIPNQILFWNHAGGVVQLGLTRRREAELKLFLTPVENEATS